MEEKREKLKNNKKKMIIIATVIAILIILAVGYIYFKPTIDYHLTLSNMERDSKEKQNNETKEEDKLKQEILNAHKKVEEAGTDRKAKLMITKEKTKEIIEKNKESILPTQSHGYINLLSIIEDTDLETNIKKDTEYQTEDYGDMKYINVYVDYKTYNIVLEQIIQTKQYAVISDTLEGTTESFASEATHLALANHHIFYVYTGTELKNYATRTDYTVYEINGGYDVPVSYTYFYEDSIYNTDSDYKNFAEYDFYDKKCNQLQGREYPSPQKYEPSKEMVQAESAE